MTEAMKWEHRDSPRGVTSDAGEVQPMVEDSIPEEHPTTSVVAGPSSASNVSSAQRTSASSRHYAKLTSTKDAQLSMGFLSPDQLSYDNHSFFEGLHPLPGVIRPF